jgi:NADH-quinone oxidoreductase subunit H
VQVFINGIFEALRMMATILGVILAAMYLAYMDRKIQAKVQLHLGPNRSGLWGLLQPFADLIKFSSKNIIPGPNKFLFSVAPGFTLLLGLGIWGVVPLDAHRVIENLDVGILYVLFLLTLGEYGAIVGGWASGSKFALLGAIRAGVQQMCYQLILGLIFVAVVLLTGALDLSKVVEAQRSCWLVLPLFPLFVIFILCGLSEAGNSPFDAEKSGELRGGYETAYSGISLWFFMLSDYVLLLTFSALATVLFLGGWLPLTSALPQIPGMVWFLGKMVGMLFAFLWIKASVPQIPQDQFISYSEKIFLPFTVGWIILAAAIKLILDI